MSIHIRLSSLRMERKRTILKWVIGPIFVISKSQILQEQIRQCLALQLQHICFKIFSFWFLPQVFFNIRFTSYINFRINPFSLLIFLSMLIPGFEFVLGRFSSIILLGNFLCSNPHKMFSSCNRSSSSNLKLNFVRNFISLDVFTF